MYRFITGDLVTADWIEIFCHQTNCFGTMGAGIAKQIARHYPEVKEMDRRLFKLLGQDELFKTIRLVKCHDGRVCANLYAQYGYGGERETDYEAFDICLDQLANFATENADRYSSIGFPMGVGCGLAGGDWKIIEPKLAAFEARIPQDVYVVIKEGSYGKTHSKYPKGAAYACI